MSPTLSVKKALVIFNRNPATALPMQSTVHTSLRIKAQASQRMEKEFENIKVNYLGAVPKAVARSIKMPHWLILSQAVPFKKVQAGKAQVKLKPNFPP